MNITIFWFRRDLRLEDNIALFNALEGRNNVLPIFIFDEKIIEELPADDARISFIYNSLKEINLKLKNLGSGLKIYKGKPAEIWNSILKEYNVVEVFANEDYEPYAIKRDKEIDSLLRVNDVDKGLNTFKDSVIFAKNEVLKGDGNPYTVFTPYKNKWLSSFGEAEIGIRNLSEKHNNNFLKFDNNFPTIESLGFEQSRIRPKPYNIDNLKDYAAIRDFPAIDSTSYLSPHLRFGTVSIRQVISKLSNTDETFLSELIWREFFMQILYHYPQVENSNFKAKYDGIKWRNDEAEFKKWCDGETGYPIVDAGMRQLNESGYMHNRVRMITAGFLCKHLLIDWRWGEAYFAKKLLDYELSSNNGNWQWAAGTGCDAAPYFRVFNPIAQLKKFDPKLEYVRKWIPDFDLGYRITPIVEHGFARERALTVYSKALKI